MILRLLLVTLTAIAIAACSSDKPKPVAAKKRQPAEAVYNVALELLENERFRSASERFDEVERLYPYSVWATKAQLMSVFSNYMIDEYDTAIASAERFIRLHPGSDDIPYAYYMIAISHYEQISDVDRDQGRTKKALETLQEVVRRFPRSEYAVDAQAKIALTRDHLAGKEMQIGLYYLKRKHFAAAINRFQVVVQDFQTTNHTPEALHRLTEAYLSLGIDDEARATAAVLGHNYPNSIWYRDSYALLSGKNLSPGESEGSWISRAWNSIF